MVILPTTKMHWHMFTGLVICKPDAASEEINQAYSNSVVMTTNKHITERDLAKGQQGLQVMLHQKVQGEPMHVVDVILTNISYLGYMSHEEFHAVPENLELASNQATRMQ